MLRSKFHVIVGNILSYKPIISQEQTFVEDMLGEMKGVIGDLDHLHLCTFFEALGTMAGSAQPEHQGQLVSAILDTYNNNC